MLQRLSFWGVIAFLTACSSTPKRPRPAKIEACAEVARRVQERDAVYASLRGSATLVARGKSVDIDAALVSGAKLPDVEELRGSGLARLELVGPFGIRLGLVSLNPKWLYVYVIPEKTVYRFPAEELSRDTLRREALFQKLPVRLRPELFFQTFLSRVEAPATLECDFDDEEVAYRLRLPAARGGRILWVEPTAFFPVRVLHFEGALPGLQELGDARYRPVSETRYTEVQGQGMASFPTKIRVRLEPSGEELEYLWRRAEAWPNVEVGVFEWEPPASLRIIDL